MTPSELLAKLLSDGNAADAVRDLIAALKSGSLDVQAVSGEFEKLMGHLQDFPRRNPAAFFRILRHVRPILVTPKLTFVTRYDDVCSVLARHDDFHVVYGPRMQAMTDGGNFFLGMQDQPAYHRDVSLMRLAMRREDISERIDPFIEATAARQVKSAGSQIDVVQQLTRIVPARWVAQYFGLPPVDEQQFINDCHDVFEFLFIAQPGDCDAQQRAAAAAARLRDGIDRTIEQRKSSARDADDVLGRCLKMQAAGMPATGDVEIRNNLFGLIVGAIPTTSEASARIVNHLLLPERTEQLAQAHAAAASGELTTVARFAWESLRFDPPNPGLLRIAPRDTVLAEGTDRETRIAAGTILLAATQSAMMDDRVLDDPTAFRIDRPSHHYLHFGHGMHACFGRYVNHVQIPRIVQAILARKNLRRLPGEAGRLKLRGPFPWSMSAEFDLL